MRLWIITAALLMTMVAAPARAQRYAGLLGGLAIVSGDARTIVNPGATQFSSYDPGNGPVLKEVPKSVPRFRGTWDRPHRMRVCGLRVSLSF